MRYSVIFVVEQENEDFLHFFDTIFRLIRETGQEFELLVVANGTERFTKSQLALLKGHSEDVKVITFQRKVPQSVCINAALGDCCGAEILLLGSVQELNTVSYEKLFTSMTDDVDLVVPYRKMKRGAALNRFHSRALNKTARLMLRTKLNDIGCNVKLIKREALESLELYGNMARYCSVLAEQKGFKVREVECEGSDRTRETKLYGPRVYLDRLTELLNLFFSANFAKKPLRFFNLVGASFLIAGIMALVFAMVQKVLFDVPIGDRPLLMVGIISVVGGAQIAGFGLLGEIISFVHGRLHKEYTIEKII